MAIHNFQGEALIPVLSAQGPPHHCGLPAQLPGFIANNLPHPPAYSTPPHIVLNQATLSLALVHVVLSAWVAPSFSLSLAN